MRTGRLMERAAVEWRRERMRERSHYHVGANIPGYLPEGEIYLCRTKEEAIALLKEEKERTLDSDAIFALEEGGRGRRFEGNAREDLSYYYVDRNDPHDLGIYFWAMECLEEECQRELELLEEGGLY